MVTFNDYYNGAFRGDLHAILAGAPRTHKHVGDPPGGTLQPRGLSLENPAIVSLPPEGKRWFAIAFYFTVLVDMVVHSQFRSFHPAFEALARYPKWRGDCPGGCYSHIDPVVIFASFGQLPGRLVPDAVTAYMPRLAEAVPTMRRETVSFFSRQMPALAGEEVWRCCCEEEPLRDLPPTLQLDLEE